ncbi:MAG TPA: Na+/H+ antiporter NhaA, partial [Mycobacterium sp.]
MPSDRFPPARKRTLLARGSWSETSRITTILRKETVGGVILLVAAAAALVWANSPWAETYFSLRDLEVGGEPFGLHLKLTLGAWAADGLLAIFFLVVGLELKREFV